MLVMEAIPPLMLLLPASVGIGALAVSAPVQQAAAVLHLQHSDAAVSMFALVCAALVAGKVKSMDWDASAGEQAALQAAVQNAERSCSFRQPTGAPHPFSISF